MLNRTPSIPCLRADFCCLVAAGIWVWLGSEMSQKNKKYRFEKMCSVTPAESMAEVQLNRHFENLYNCSEIKAGGSNKYRKTSRCWLSVIESAAEVVETGALQIKGGFDDWVKSRQDAGAPMSLLGVDSGALWFHLECQVRGDSRFVWELQGRFRFAVGFTAGTSLTFKERCYGAG